MTTPADAGQRTPQDYAIEHAGYLAAAAEAYLVAADEYIAALLIDSETTGSADTFADYDKGLRECVYEFRNRADRAALARQPAPQPVARRDVLMICDAYESGFGHGEKMDELPNPYKFGSEGAEAYQLGYEEGVKRKPAPAPPIYPRATDSRTQGEVHGVHELGTESKSENAAPANPDRPAPTVGGEKDSQSNEEVAEKLAGSHRQRVSFTMTLDYDAPQPVAAPADAVVRAARVTLEAYDHLAIYFPDGVRPVATEYSAVLRAALAAHDRSQP